MFCDRELSTLSPQSIKNSGDQELLLELIDSPIDLRSIKNFLRSGALIRARWLPDRSKTSCDQKLLLELIDSIVDQKLSYNRELLSDFIDSLIDQNLLAIRSSFESTLSLSELIWLPDKVTNFLRSEALIRAHWPPDRPTSNLWSGALIRAHWLPDWSKTSCDQELFLEHIDSLIDQQLSCDRELLSKDFLR